MASGARVASGGRERGVGEREGEVAGRDGGGEEEVKKMKKLREREREREFFVFSFFFSDITTNFFFLFQNSRLSHLSLSLFRFDRFERWSV